MRKPIFFVESRDVFYCPECGATLLHRDFKPRVMKFEGGQKSFIRMERLKCSSCEKLHNALPDCLTPYKHYRTEIISGVIDEVITPDDLDDENYPCETTMNRWHHWKMANHLRIDGYLKSIAYRSLGFSAELLKSELSLLDELRKSCGNWLETILRIIYNSGGFLVSS